MTNKETKDKAIGKAVLHDVKKNKDKYTGFDELSEKVREEFGAEIRSEKIKQFVESDYKDEKNRKTMTSFDDVLGRNMDQTPTKPSRK